MGTFGPICSRNRPPACAAVKAAAAAPLGRSGVAQTGGRVRGRSSSLHHAPAISAARHDVTVKWLTRVGSPPRVTTEGPGHDPLVRGLSFLEARSDAKRATTMIVGHRREGATSYVPEGLSGDPPRNAWCHTIAHSEDIFLQCYSTQPYFPCCAESELSGRIP